MTRSFFVLLGLVLSAGIMALAWATDGFRIVTSEGERALAIERSPLAVPDAALVDQDGDVLSINDYSGRTLLVDFIYTRCPTICTFAGDGFQHVLARLGKDTAGSRVDLLSISFDLQNDDREALKLYGQRFGAVAPHWRIAKPADPYSLVLLLKAFGVIVIPDGLGGFVHNSAVYLVDARGRLVRMLDPDMPEQIVAFSEHESNE